MILIDYYTTTINPELPDLGLVRRLSHAPRLKTLRAQGALEKYGAAVDHDGLTGYELGIITG